MSAPQPAPLENLMAEAKAPTETNPSWERVQLARHPKRPYTLDYIAAIFQDFMEMHGDRRFADDPAIVAGLARLDGGAPLEQTLGWLPEARRESARQLVPNQANPDCYFGRFLVAA